jgi:hypothetical protein
MSTAAAPIVSTTPHPAWYARAGTWFLKIGQAIKGAILKIAGDMPAVQAEIVKVAPTVEAMSNMLLAGSGDFEAHLLNLWGVAANAVQDAGQAAGANALNITLDQQLVNDIKGFLPAVSAYLHPAASPTPPPGPAPGAPPASTPASGTVAATVTS